MAAARRRRAPAEGVNLQRVFSVLAGTRPSPHWQTPEGVGVSPRLRNEGPFSRGAKVEGKAHAPSIAGSRAWNGLSNSSRESDGTAGRADGARLHDGTLGSIIRSEGNTSGRGREEQGRVRVLVTNDPAVVLVRDHRCLQVEATGAVAYTELVSKHVVGVGIRETGTTYLRAPWR